MSEVSDTLLHTVKNYLDITWKDVEQDAKIKKIVLRGMMRINELVGAEMDYETSNLSQTLLLMYVMYDLSKSLDEFFKNYRSEILFLKNKERVHRYAEKEDANI